MTKSQIDSLGLLDPWLGVVVLLHLESHWGCLWSLLCEQKMAARSQLGGIQAEPRPSLPSLDTQEPRQQWSPRGSMTQVRGYR